MKLQIRIPAERNAAPDELLQTVQDTASRKASAWTEPTYLGYEDGAHLFEVDAVPKASITTTANVAPALLPPHVV